MANEEMIRRLRDPLDDAQKAKIKEGLTLCQEAENLITKMERAGMPIPDALEQMRCDHKILKGIDQQFGNRN